AADSPGWPDRTARTTPRARTATTAGTTAARTGVEGIGTSLLHQPAFAVSSAARREIRATTAEGRDPWAGKAARETDRRSLYSATSVAQAEHVARCSTIRRDTSPPPSPNANSALSFFDREQVMFLFTGDPGGSFRWADSNSETSARGGNRGLSGVRDHVRG